ncbi:MAG: DinB family protein [Reichenbachiella sp.]|uniref:DinB family protein n=1 Tax=Reichenbachiella sp. TaxID=2184521 RepID=UPI002966517D|nr:DinB family protein [Reichenbachiella sp.]MDW3208978.1 DinB family protein [Reichenbachiella sp.]
MDIIPASQRILDQLTHLLENLTNDEYSKTLAVLHDNSIGQHMRHTLEFFICLTTGLTSGVVNYDERERDVFLESNTLEALTIIAKLKETLDEIKKNQPLKLLQQGYDVGSDKIYEVESNLYRELIYNIEHAVHHMALMKIGLREVKPELELPKDFGVASSTIKFRQSQQANA